MFDKKAKVSQVMTSEVVTVQSNDTMDKVAELFKSNYFHHIPVVDYGKVVGIISSMDYHMLEDHFTLFNNKNSEAMNEAIMRSLLVKDVMTQQIAVIGPDDTVEFAAGIFRENLFHALPVADSHKNFLGIITSYDLLNFAYADAPPVLN
ncbi:MAG: CBS domain-containing protein [Saprospiraceae bacterium]|jgi:CBS domain-containing protein